MPRLSDLALLAVMAAAATCFAPTAGRRTAPRARLRAAKQAGPFDWLTNLTGPPSGATEDCDVVIIGAGVAGLACARALADTYGQVVLLDGANEVGGRVRTDVHPEGYLLDRGFQVFIEAYPEVRGQFGGDYAPLDLQSFQPGALVATGSGNLARVSDPFRRPDQLLEALLAPVGSLVDKVRVGVMRVTTPLRSDASLLEAAELTTETHLRGTWGLSDGMLDGFFRPFYQGIFLAPLSAQSSRMFDFVFKMLATGGTSLPRLGMGEVPRAMAASLPEAVEVRLGKAATAIAADGAVRVAGGGALRPRHGVVVAVDAPSASKLLGGGGGGGGGGASAPMEGTLQGRGSTCLYYGFAGEAPVTEPVLVLNPGPCDGPGGATRVNNVCFPSAVSDAYAPAGKSLASVTVVGVAGGVPDARLDADVRGQLDAMFPAAATAGWKLLRVYRVPYAQPAQTPPNAVGFGAGPTPVVRRTTSGGVPVVACGDYRATATLNGAVASGRRAAKAIVEA